MEGLIMVDGVDVAILDIVTVCEGVRVHVGLLLLLLPPGVPAIVSD